MLEYLLSLLFAGLLVALGMVAVGRGLVPGPVSRGPVVLLTLIWAAGVAFMTLRPGSGLGVRLNLVPLQFDGRGSAVDAVLNVFVFVPLGLLLVLAGARILTVFGIALATTLSIEITQYLLDDGRTADVNDLITNTAGALLGAVLMLGVRALARRRIRPAPAP